MTDAESSAWLGLISVSQLLPAALNSQLQRDAGLTHFEFGVLNALYFAPRHTLPMTALAQQTSATLPRLSHVCSRLHGRGIVDRSPHPDDRRVTVVRLTDAGKRAFIRALPGHLATARALVIDALTPEQLDALTAITTVIRTRLGADADCAPTRGS